MKRHLQTEFGMTPEDYRAKRGLPSDCPMVDAGCAAKRSELALSLGSGRKKVEPVAASATEGAPAKPGLGHEAANRQAKAA